MIAMNDFKAEPSELREAMFLAAKRVLDSGWYVLGPEVSRFEADWADRCGVRHAIGVGNGMDAIEIILRALGIGPGDEVITTPMTAFATVLAVIRAGATPVLADIDAETGLLSPDSVARCIGERTRAVLLVHLYGQLRSMSRWQALCDETGVMLLEDCAQAHEASWSGVKAGAFGHAGAYSFYPTKNLGAPGDGGAIVTNDDGLAEAARRLRNYGQRERYHHPDIGLNSRLDELHAAMLSTRLAWLDRFTERRRQVAATYRRDLRNPTVALLAAPEEEAAHVHHLFVVRSRHRAALQAHLHEHGVQTLSHYPVPVHRQDACPGLARDPAGLSASERHAATCLSLPCHPQLSDADVGHVIEAVNAFSPGG